MLGISGAKFVGKVLGDSGKFIVIILRLYSHIHKLCQFSVGKHDKNKLKENHSQRKHAIRIIFRKDKFSRTTELFVQNKVFNFISIKHFEQPYFHA